jgi:hypothetical protein
MLLRGIAVVVSSLTAALAVVGVLTIDNRLFDALLLAAMVALIGLTFSPIIEHPAAVASILACAFAGAGLAVVYGTHIGSWTWDNALAAPHGKACTRPTQTKGSHKSTPLPPLTTAVPVTLTPVPASLSWNFGQARDCRTLQVLLTSSRPLSPHRLHVHADRLVRTDSGAAFQHAVVITQPHRIFGARTTFLLNVSLDPNGAPPGEYDGLIRIGGKQLSAISIPVKVTQKDRLWKALIPAVLAALGGVLIKTFHDDKLVRTATSPEGITTTDGFTWVGYRNHLLSFATLVSAIIGVSAALLTLVGLYSNNPTFGADYGGRDLVAVLSAAFAAVGAQAVLQGASASTPKKA